MLHPDRLFSSDPTQRAIARRLFEPIERLPIVSPHGHTDPAWFADNQPFDNPAALLIQPDHYVFRMLYSQGVPLGDLGIASHAQEEVADPASAWRCFAEHYYLFRGTPSDLWMRHVFGHVFGIDKPLNANTADDYYATIHDALQSTEFLPRNLFERFNIEWLATTESPLDPLPHHAKLITDPWQGQVITTFRPDPVLDPEFEGFVDNVHELGQLTGEDTNTWEGYLRALENRRAYFRAHGATATDHGHPTPATADLPAEEATRLFTRVLREQPSPQECELFRAQMLTEMARMSCEDGMVMQLHPGSFRNHNQWLFDQFGRDKGADIPVRTSYVEALRPLLTKFGNRADFTLILFTLDETTYSRELSPLAGHYPCLRLGPAWWFHDSPEGMLRYREQTTETAGFYNTVGFNDDTRAFLSIPARHDVARRVDCAYLAKLVAEHRLEEDAAAEIAVDLAGNLAKQAYKLT